MEPNHAGRPERKLGAFPCRSSTKAGTKKRPERAEPMSAKKNRVAHVATEFLAKRDQRGLATPAFFIQPQSPRGPFGELAFEVLSPRRTDIYFSVQRSDVLRSRRKGRRFFGKFPIKTLSPTGPLVHQRFEFFDALKKFACASGVAGVLGIQAKSPCGTFLELAILIHSPMDEFFCAAFETGHPLGGEYRFRSKVGRPRSNLISVVRG